MKPKHRDNSRRELGGRWFASMERFAAVKSKADEAEKFLLTNGSKPTPRSGAIGIIGGVRPKRGQSR